MNLIVINFQFSIFNFQFSSYFCSVNRLGHLLRAKTQFSLHSPFVYELYTEVLCSRAEGAPKGRFEEVVWRLEQRYGATSIRGEGTAELHSAKASFFVFDHPHRNEKHWEEFVDSPNWQVTLDLFTVGIAVANPHLSKQHFILR